MPSSCSGSLATFQVTIYFDKSLRELVKKSTCQQFSPHCRREWSFNLEQMEANAGSSDPHVKQPLECSTSNNEENKPAENHSHVKRPLECSTSTNEGNKPSEKEVSSSLFVNHAAIAWHANRRKWIGDQSRRPERMTEDPIISWSTTYEELLSTGEPFSEPIPLAEMVDFLVDIWHDEGLFD